MRVVDRYSFKNGLEILKKEKPDELSEVIDAIKHVDAEKCKTKVSKEKTMPGKMLYSPKALNKEILDNFLYKKGWSKPKIPFERPGSFIEGDGVKNGVGLEVQFGKYAFLGWDIFGKMVIFARHEHYKYGIEVVPMASLRKKMSTGIGSFEQITNILEKRGKADLDIPVAVLGVDV
jgi:hypothetical protein